MKAGPLPQLILVSLVAASVSAQAGPFRVRTLGTGENTPAAAGSTVIRFTPVATVARAPAQEDPDSEPAVLPAASPEPVVLKSGPFEIKSDGDFPVEPALQGRVQFWIKVYTELGTSEGVIHDAKHVDIIYSKVDFTDISDFTLSARQREKIAAKRIKAEKKRITDILRSIQRKENRSQALNDEERKIAVLLSGVNEPNKYVAAAHRKRIRFQLGQKDRFLQGLYYSGRYLPLMERIFKAKGLPVELTRLPFVESSFNLRARSKVGASGIWQFMPSTGRIFMRIDDAVDERNDPIRATEAAAALLKGNYEALGNWPLALTAYNHGRLGMVRAAEKVKSRNLSDIIANYKSGSFGFASSNFYCEFMAAMEIARNPERYFGDKVQRDKPTEFAEFVITEYVDFRDLSTYTRIPRDVLQDMNPGLSDLVIKSQKLIPSGYVLRIPPDNRDTFLSRYNEIPGHRKFSSQKRSPQRRFAGAGAKRKNRR